MTNNSRSLRIFLCHASQDKTAVRELNKRLKSENWLDPWLDEEKLSLGQNWKTVIEDALRAADIVIIFLSKNSVQKEGFVQRELNHALELSLEKPPDIIYLIPFRLDDCEVPRQLRERHWGDYFGEKKEGTYHSLLQSLKERHNHVLHIEAEKRTQYENNSPNPILLTPHKESSKSNLLSWLTGKNQLPDFRVHQRDHLLSISRSMTQELDPDKLLPFVLKTSIDILAGQAGMIAIKEQNGWNIANAHGVSPAFLSYLNPLLADEDVRTIDVRQLNRMLKELTYTASMGLLNGTALPLTAHEQVFGVIFIFRNYPDLFTQNDRVLLQSFADQAAIALYNARLFKNVTASSTTQP